MTEPEDDVTTVDRRDRLSSWNSFTDLVRANSFGKDVNAYRLLDVLEALSEPMKKNRACRAAQFELNQFQVLNSVFLLTDGLPK